MAAKDKHSQSSKSESQSGTVVFGHLLWLFAAGQVQMCIRDSGYTVYEPMNYTDESGTFTGFDTELATAVCEKLGVEPDFVEINWDTKETELAAKSIDCIWNGLTLTDDREANMACTCLLYTSTPLFSSALMATASSESASSR